MKTMISGIVVGRSLGAVVSAAALLCVAAFSGVSPARAQEDTNMFNSVLGFVGMQFDKEQDAIDYRARPPIVVPPKIDLPPPKVAVRDPSWPKDPDVIAERRAALDSRRPAPQITPNTRVEMSQTELQQGRGPLPADGPPDECQAGAGTPICLYAPWKALKSMVSSTSSDKIQPGPEPQRKYLTEPPPGYRKATGVAKATIEAPKDQPDVADPGAFIRSQGHKLSVDN
ncbi:hypothetical protein QEV83_18480 [Methylocapsa sp. D3K7]|uniref:hypothetical protein n=1 Tax=Methylocapsa sp. D3K7 TaxID=3041435 RepID=UPI00244EF1A4|nr:hypothetical protein [Methylocapsa sp. D3K7]WGJ14577.1 hypothetical protein QEV83_18480 [Methylocapsa sp. D3K7]